MHAKYILICGILQQHWRKRKQTVLLYFIPQMQTEIWKKIWPKKRQLKIGWKIAMLPAIF